MDTSCHGTVTLSGDATRLEGSAVPVSIPDFKAPEHYINRELSLLEFTNVCSRRPSMSRCHSLSG